MELVLEEDRTYFSTGRESTSIWNPICSTRAMRGRKLRRQILSCTNMFMQQLSALLDDQMSDLPKFCNLGFGIHILGDRIQAMYLKIIYVNTTAMNITKICAGYVVEVLNDSLFAKGIQGQ